jgi:hypothetical protein
MSITIVISLENLDLKLDPKNEPSKMMRFVSRLNCPYSVWSILTSPNCPDPVWTIQPRDGSATYRLVAQGIESGIWSPVRIGKESQEFSRHRGTCRPVSMWARSLLSCRCLLAYVRARFV